MRLSIMQPYFLPYIGYFQLINSSDIFIVYDNIQYTKKGWINRNRFLLNGKDALFSLPIKKDSDYLDIRQRELAGDFNKVKLLNQIRGAYKSAPYFTTVFPMIEEIMNYDETNLFGFIHHSILNICQYLDINTEIRISSDINIDHNKKSEEKVLTLCRATGASTYINTIGGVELYSKKFFANNGIELKFIRSKPFEYPQFETEFVPWLSILDVMMFNNLDKISNYLKTGFEFK